MNNNCSFHSVNYDPNSISVQLIEFSIQKPLEFAAELLLFAKKSSDPDYFPEQIIQVTYIVFTLIIYIRCY